MTEDPVLALARALTDAHDQVQVELDGAGPREVDRALQFLLSALSAPVSADQTYRLRGDVGDAVYAGVQVYTKGPGYNAPSASISDTDLQPKRSTIMTTTRSMKRSAGLIATALLVAAAAAGCDDGDDADAAYCDSLVEMRQAFESYSEIDVVEGGLDSIRTYVDGIETALADVRSANDARIGEEADAFRTALDELVTTLTSGDLPVDRREEVRAAADDVERTWDELVAAGEIECPDLAG
jgi:hypothetical protein